MPAPNTSFYPVEVNPAIQAMPTSFTDVATTDSKIYQITFANTNASAATVTVTDKNGSPLAIVPTSSVAANQSLTLTAEFGWFMKGGFRWTASTAGVNVSVVAFSRRTVPA